MIPSLTGNVDRVVESLRRQTFTDWELIVVTGVRPAGRSRNRGVELATGEFVLFLDDDAELGHPRVLQQMVDTLVEPGVGVVGSSKILPPHSSAFVRRVAFEVPRWVEPVVDRPIESNPPTTAYGFSGITTTCCLLRVSDVREAGGFNEDLVTGEDTEFFFRLRQAGKRFVIPANCWVYHSPPQTLRGLLKKSFNYGVGHASEARLAPRRNMDLVPLDRGAGKAILVLAPFLVGPSMFLPLSLSPRPNIRPGFRPLKALSMLATLYGYAWGYFRGRD